LLISGLLAGYANAQSALTYRGSYMLKDDFKGIATYGYKKYKNDSIVMHGNFSFTSDVYEIETSNTIYQVNINGAYREGLKVGAWSYEQNDYRVKINRLNNLQVDARLTGMQKNLQASYINGLPGGKWVYSINRVEQSKRLGTGARLEAYFKNGYATAEFLYNNSFDYQPVIINGNFDEKGRLHGRWILHYSDSANRYIEERQYSEGFLLELRIKLRDKDSVIASLLYGDVKEKLRMIEDLDSICPFKKGDKHFGVLFNDGYRSNEPKFFMQQGGNELLESAFKLVSDTTSSIFGVPGFTFPKIGYTRRFQYIYPDYEPYYLQLIDSVANTGFIMFDSLENSTVLKINKQKNDTLSLLYHFIDMAHQKMNIVIEEQQKILSTRFDYENRENYYRNGVSGLGRYDTVKFEIAGKSYSVPITFAYAITSYDSIVMQLYNVAVMLNTMVLDYLNPVVATLAQFKQEQTIDSLDEYIVMLDDSLRITYLGKTKITIDEVSGRIVTAKPITDIQLQVYALVGKNKFEKLLKEYSNEIEIDKKLVKGNQICQLLESLISAYPKLEEISAMPPKLDEAYTRRSPNPFFEREIITRIKPAIYAKGAERLFSYFVDEIGKSTTKQELNANIDLLYKLEAKLILLAKSDSQEVNRLNTRLRRENQPERIRRFLGL
jgi:hypothetical protein